MRSTSRARPPWQAELWSRLRQRLDEPSPAERVEQACERLRAEPSLVALPERISLFGLTRIPAGHLAVLRALAAGREVHLFLLHPSPALWEKIGAREPVVRREDDTTAALADNRLLASWGQDSREMQLVLGTHEHVAHHHAIDAPADSLLARIQADVRADRRPEPRPLSPSDRSIQIHSCHGRARQVEILRDAILHLLAEDDTLQPRDVIVMCPDIESFAPLIQATFGAADVVDDDEFAPLPEELRPTDLRVRLADRSLRQTNPVLGVVAQLIDLAGRRLTASDVLDLADREPVRRRFNFDDEDLARIRDWVADSGIRWGLDAAHRAPYKLQDLPAGTWRAGLDRVLVGVTMTEEGHRLFEGVLPVDDVESLAIGLAGRMAELVDRVQEAVDAFATAKPISEWVQDLATAADALTATSQRDAWQRAQLERILGDVVSEAADTTLELTLLEVRALLAERLQGRPTRANFRTGHLTICTLVPMRSVPHRVVCLLGLDDAAFPRKAPRDGDDVMLADPHVGDRDPRPEDRQMLLDALMAAEDRLIVTYAGNDVRTNTPQPPAVPVGELLDTIDRMVDGDARAQVLVRHPLQPFDPRNFKPGELGGDAAWSFNRVTLDGARAMEDERVEPRPFLASPLPPRREPILELDDLVAFVRHPVRAFLRQRLGFGVATYADEVADALPIELDSLESWQVGQRMLDARLAGATADAAVAAERARGELPPGVLAEPVIAKLLPDVEQIVKHAADLLPDATPAGSVDVRVTLPDGRRLNGTVPDVHGTLLRTVTYSRVNPRHRLMTWVRFLALTAAHPDRAFEAATIGRAIYGAPRGTTVTVVRLPRMAPEVALEHLASLAAPVRRRHVRAAAAGMQDLGRLRGGAPRRRRRGQGGQGGVGERVELPARGPGARAHARVRRRAVARRAAGSPRLRAVRAAAVGRRARLGAGGVRMTEPFDVCGPLPTGVTVLEASAGTGKTFTIAALAARYVADGVPLHQLLMVTFTRMATGELRERVRERLVSAEHGLERALAGAPDPEDDEVVKLLADGSPTVVALRRERLAAALADFDSATIATTHGFCQEVLGGLGVLGDIEADTTFLEDVTDLRDEVVDDLYVRRFARRGTPEFSRSEALAIARTAIDNPAAPIEPADAPDNTIAAMRVRLAGAARTELDARKRRTGVMTYDDLLTRLHSTLVGESGEVAAARLRARYRVVLVDEFQDTDPVQWEIMRTAFGDGEVTLVLIGDPKQAIYAFRGADVYAYIEAARTAGTEATLTVNRRSDQGLIDAYDALFDGAKLGHEGIVYRHVSAAHAGARLHGAPDPAPLRIRVVPRDEVGLTAKGFALLDPAREHVARDVAADIVALLRSGAEVDGEGRIRPGHIAVLVRTNRTAARVRDALEAVDVPAVINGAGSVFGTEPALEWLRLLEAIERPSYPPRARSAALTTFLGWTTEQVAAADDDAWEAVHSRLHHWARVLRAKGVASLMEAVTLEEGLPARVLAMVDGERRMTDLRHVGELLHAAAMTEQMGATALTAWLRERVLEATTDNNDEERSRRLESDAEAVQVLTMHRSKGLEFPVVYYPDLWEPSPTPREKEPVTFHDAAGTADDRRRPRRPAVEAGTGSSTSTSSAARTCGSRTSRSRARKHQAVVWWAGSWASRDSALSRLLFARDDEGNVKSSGAAVPTDTAARARFLRAGGRRPGARERGCGGPGPLVSWPGDATATSPLSASSFDRTLDWWWRRTSFSDITAGTYEPHVASEPEEPLVDDESGPHAPPVDDDGRDALRAVPSLLAEMSVGTEVGTLVHRVFEAVDFASADLSAELARGDRRRAGAPPGRARRHRRGGRGAHAPRSRHRSARSPAASPCATSPEPTASTSSTSSCRWSAATTRAVRR